jgi:hypothetical protein
MSDDTLLLFDGLDQSITTDHDWALKRVEEIIQQSVVSRDAYVALNACKSLIQVSKISGLSLAKALYLVKSNWSNYDIEDEFEDVAYSYIGLHPHTISRYVCLWKAYDKNLIPENVREEIQQQNVKQQIPIAMALEQGYEIDDATWKKLSDAPDLSSVSKILREDVKGQEPRKGSLQLSIDNIGTIWAFAEGNRYFVGSLEVDSDEEFIQKSIERIKKGAGIL